MQRPYESPSGSGDNGADGEVEGRTLAERFAESEFVLHRLGYRYTGRGNLYGLTLHEIKSLTDSLKKMNDQMAGFSENEISAFEGWAGEQGLL